MENVPKWFATIPVHLPELIEYWYSVIGLKPFGSDRAMRIVTLPPAVEEARIKSAGGGPSGATLVELANVRSRDADALWKGDVVSVTVTENVKVPESDIGPVSCPAAEREYPGGRAPAVTLQEYDPEGFSTSSQSEYLTKNELGDTRAWVATAR
jgi:hypothetical protein